jgi:hypothetical protein
MFFVPVLALILSISQPSSEQCKGIASMLDSVLLVPHPLYLRGGQAQVRSRRARKRRYWKPLPQAANKSSVEGLAVEGLAVRAEDHDSIVSAKRERKEVSNGIQGVLVTANCFASKSWRHRVSEEMLHILSNAAKELITLNQTETPDSKQTLDEGSPGLEETPNPGRDTRRPGQCVSNPSKWRKLTEQAETAFQSIAQDRSVTAIDNQGGISRGESQNTQQRLRISPMKVDLR